MKIRDITQIALFGAIGFAFYAITAAIIDPILPLIGCLIRPIIFLTYLSSQFHFNKRTLIYIALLSSALYALVIPCFVNGASIPVSLVFILVSNEARSKLNSFITVLASSLAAFVALALVALLFSKKSTDFTNILKSFPIVLVTAVLVGIIRFRFGKVNCIGCNLCDRADIAPFISNSNFKKGVSK